VKKIKVIEDLTEAFELLDITFGDNDSRISYAKTILENCIEELQKEQNESIKMAESLRTALAAWVNRGDKV
jgi:hypothetical protein